MKWIKTAIGAVIGIVSIGIIVTIVYKMTQSSEVIKEVSFEIDYDEDYDYEYKYYPTSIYNEILEYAVIDEYHMVTNIVSGYVNNDEIDDISMLITDVVTFDGDIDGVDIFYEIMPEGDALNAGHIDDDVTIKFVFAVPQPPRLTGNIAALILLVPIVFVGGVVLFYYKPFKKD